jgi:hypothetical protein
MYYGHTEIQLGKWIKKLTGEVVIVTGARINTTNAVKDFMIEYQSQEILPEEFGCVREVNDFLEKFERVE